MYTLLYAKVLFLQKLKSQIDREPDPVKVRRLYQLSEMVDDTALGYLMATQDLDALAVEA